MALAGVKVEGLKELRRALNRLDPELTKGLRGEMLVLGKEIAADAQRRVPTGKTGRAKGSIRAGVSGNNAYVAGGKKAVPYYGWLDFGSRTPKADGNRASGPWASSGAGPKGGRFIYKAIDENRPHIKRRAIEALRKAERAANLK